MKFIALVPLLLFGLYSSATAQVDTARDERLNAKITYFSGYTRLSSAIDLISKTSGVRIYAGSSSKDWQVRDLPVVICANDIPLSRLLKMMTDTYFLSCSATKVGDVLVYTLYRPKSLVRQLDEYSESMHDYASQLTAAEWNTLWWAGSLTSDETDELYKQLIQDYPRFGDIYASSIGDSRLAFDEIVLYGRLTRALGQEGIARISSGETVSMNAEQGGEVGMLVADYARLRYAIHNSRMNAISNGERGSVIPPDESDIQRASISFRTNPSGDARNPLYVTMEMGSSPGGGIAFTGDLSGFTASVSRDHLPPVPGTPPSQNRDLREVSQNDDIDAEKKDELGLAPEGDVRLADLLYAISVATGYTIVSDDYLDHKKADPNRYRSLFHGKISMLDIRKALIGFTWYEDKRTKRIILRDSCWCDRYNNLLPRATFEYLLKKMNSVGFGLTDLLAVCRMTKGQMLDWIADAEGLDVLYAKTSSGNPGSIALLKMLATLDDRVLSSAMSDAVPASRFGANELAEVLKHFPEISELEDTSQLGFQIVREVGPDGNRSTYIVRLHGSGTLLKLPLEMAFPVECGGGGKETKKGS